MEDETKEETKLEKAADVTAKTSKWYLRAEVLVGVAVLVGAILLAAVLGVS